MLALIALSLLVAGDANTKRAAASDTEQASDPQDKIICRRFIETGSLVKGYRVCKSKRDWARERDAIRQSGPGIDSCGNRGNGGPC